MTYILFSLAVLFGLTMRKSKICTIYIISVMVFLAVFCYKCADIANYKTEYEQALGADSFRYIGYTYLLRLSANVGLSWIQYRLLFYLTIFIILVSAIKMLTRNVNIVLALYLITYYGKDVVQMKSHIADVISFFAIALFIKHVSDGKSFKNFGTVASIILLMISALMHFSAAFYLIAFFVFAMLYHKKNMTKKMMVILFVLIAAMYSGAISIIAQYANQLGILSDMRYLSGWFQINTRYGYLIPVLFAIIAILSCNLSIYPGEENNYNSDSRSEINILLSRFMITSLMLIPLFVLNTTYDRLMRVYILIALSCYANRKIYFQMSRVKFISLVLTIFTIVFALYSETYAYYDSTLGAILKYNSIL